MKRNTGLLILICLLMLICCAFTGCVTVDQRGITFSKPRFGEVTYNPPPPVVVELAEEEGK